MRIPQRTMTGGEVNEELWYASDLAPIRTGAARVRNMIVRKTGGVERTPGTEHIAIAKTAGKVAFGSFRRSLTESYLLEYGDNYVRIRDASMSVAAPAHVELATPWAHPVTGQLRMATSNDVQWTFSGQRLKELRNGPVSWSLVDATISGGPYVSMDPDETRTITVSAVTGGAITLTASAALFDPLHVGAFFRLEERDFSGTDKWEAGQAVALAKKVRFNGNTYECTKAGTTSGNPPTHFEGRERDGVTATNVEWEYLHAGFGVVKITAVASAVSATATVITRLSDQLLTGTTRWQEGEWSDLRGWPKTGALYKNALWAANTRSRPAFLWKSAIEGFDDFAQGIGEDSALDRPLYSEQTQDIGWLSSSSSYLAIGAGGAEWIARPDRNGDTVRTNNLITDVATTEGSSTIPGITINGVTVFVDASLERLLGMKYDYRSEQWQPEELSLLASHLLGVGVVDIKFQRTPWPVFWLLLSDGTITGCTYLPAQNILAWHHHNFQDPVEAIAVLPVDGGVREALFLGVRRSASIHIERMVDRYRVDRGETAKDAWYLMGAKRYDLGVEASIFTGLDHLEGRTVSALVDGKNHPPLVVAGGQVTLTYPGKKVLIGLRYMSRWKSLPPDAGLPDRDIVSKRKHVTDIHFTMKDTLGGDVIVGDTVAPCFRFGDAPLDEEPKLFNGPLPVGTPAPGTTGQIEYQNDTPWPATLTGFFPEFEV